MPRDGGGSLGGNSGLRTPGPRADGTAALPWAKLPARLPTSHRNILRSVWSQTQIHYSAATVRCRHQAVLGGGVGSGFLEGWKGSVGRERKRHINNLGQGTRRACR